MKLNGAKARSISDFLLKIYEAEQVTEFGNQLISAFGSLLPYEMVGYNERDTTTGQMFGIVAPTIGGPLGETFLARVREHPAINHIIDTADRNAVKVSDFLSQRQFRQLGLYHDFYRPLRIRYQLGFGCPVDPGRVMFVALSRTTRDFSEEERTVLNLVRPHICQAWRRAKVLTDLRSISSAKSLRPAANEESVALEKMGLTPREAEVLHWIASGKTNEEIAIILGVSFFTVKTHVKHIFARLGVETRTAAAAYLFERLGPG